MFNDVVTVPKLGDFIVDVQPSRVRLCLEERKSGKHIVDVTLDLQGFNEFGTIIWLSHTLRIQWQANARGPTSDDQQRIFGMYVLYDIIKEELKSLGYQVRPGRHVVPASYRPLNGEFDYASPVYTKLKESLDLRSS